MIYHKNTKGKTNLKVNVKVEGWKTSYCILRLSSLCTLWLAANSRPF